MGSTRFNDIQRGVPRMSSSLLSKRLREMERSGLIAIDDHEVDAEARAMAEVWIGRTELGAAMRSRRVRVTGPDHLVRGLPDWLGFSTFAYPDPAAELTARIGA